MLLQKGDMAPKFCLKNQDAIEVNLADLQAQIIVLYFYPKDNTSGCTIQAQDFTSLLPLFEAKGAIVVGISPDSPKSHKKFIQSKNLSHILLSDTQKEVARAYGAYGKKMLYGKEVMGIIRSTFIIKDGKIEEAFYNVRAKEHAQKILDCLDKLE